MVDDRLVSDEEAAQIAAKYRFGGVGSGHITRLLRDREVRIEALEYQSGRIAELEPELDEANARIAVFRSAVRLFIDQQTTIDGSLEWHLYNHLQGGALGPYDICATCVLKAALDSDEAAEALLAVKDAAIHLLNTPGENMGYVHTRIESAIKRYYQATGRTNG